MKRFAVGVASLLVLTLVSGCIRYEGAHKGRVVDADTGEPIEGVVILGVWSREHAGPAGGTHTYYDARETVTDKDGEFVIPGIGLTGGVVSFVEPMDANVFKAGYEYIGGFWDSLHIGPAPYRKRIRWEGDKVIISLKKLTMEEREKMGTPPSPPHETSIDQVRRMLREIDKDRIERGLPPRGTWGGEKI
jgi:hypothetical protein